jgi:hypothetical protein
MNLLDKLKINKIISGMILIEVNENQGVEDMMHSMGDQDAIIYTPTEVEFGRLDKYFCNLQNKVAIDCGSIKTAMRIMGEIKHTPDFHIINRIDMMDIDLPKRKRGTKIIASLARMMSEKILRGSCLIVISGRSEYRIREMADKIIDAKI